MRSSDHLLRCMLIRLHCCMQSAGACFSEAALTDSGPPCSSQRLMVVRVPEQNQSYGIRGDKGTDTLKVHAVMHRRPSPLKVTKLDAQPSSGTAAARSCRMHLPVMMLVYYKPAGDNPARVQEARLHQITNKFSKTDAPPASLPSSEYRGPGLIRLS